MSSLYDRDFYAWANEQAALLRAGQWSAADVARIAEEIESMGRSEKRELVSRLTVLLLRLLKWQFQPALRGNSWRLSIANARDRLVDHLDDNPSLKAKLPDATASAYRYARREASAESGLPEDIFPPGCPWSFETFMAQDFWPE
ncbi:hypothetical protein J2847_003605 [Azospirillum agricola]|uniref:DUF29 domain-containing protein n=1 Tax=Azospirillum agricola TaxID=1720247 RepID=UPI001AE294D3|nr:DUF29 domain-containing protein [Azospirillum agricola]MBP2230302.1 hypothetical protein [Azospirillum agricola]